MEVRSWAPPNRRRWRLGLIAVLLVGVGATSQAALNMLDWRSSVVAAVAVSRQPGRPTTDRVNASVVLQRSALEAVQAIRSIAAGHDEAAAGARVALANIAEATR